MNITLQGLIPLPLENSLKPDGFWGTDYVFQKGQNYLLSAESGKGKSTLIHIIHGSRRDYRGNIWYGEQNLKDISSEQLAELRRAHFAYVFQDLRIFHQLSVMDNLRLVHQISPIESFEKKAKDLLNRLNIFELSERKGQQLSYGQRQRVAIARALIGHFQWLILDEPFAHLDSANSAKAMDLIESVCDEKNASFILSSHHTAVSAHFHQQIQL